MMSIGVRGCWKKVTGDKTETWDQFMKSFSDKQSRVSIFIPLDGSLRGY